MTVTERLFTLQDTKYRDFSARLTPNISKDAIIGVRAPAIRALAKELYGTDEAARFMAELPHKYFDENNLHGALICRIRDYASAMAETERFLPYIDNWAVCDMLSPKVFAKHRGELYEKIKQWTASRETYTVRFGIGMLMEHFLDKDFTPKALELAADIRSEEIVSGIESDEYYVNMMTAWFFATALAKQYEAALPYIEDRRLDAWTHNKAIQKSIESRRITDGQKAYLRSLKLK